MIVVAAQAREGVLHCSHRQAVKHTSLGPALRSIGLQNLSTAKSARLVQPLHTHITQVAQRVAPPPPRRPPPQEANARTRTFPDLPQVVHAKSCPPPV